MGNIDRFRAGVEAVNARDWATQRSMLAEDFTSVDHSTGTTVTGADAFVEQQMALLESFPDQVISVTNIAEAGNVVLAEMVSDATHTAPLPLPTGGTIPATGRRVTVHCAVSCMYDANGMAYQATAYVNPLEVLEQIGAVPAVPQQITLSDRTGATTG